MTEELERADNDSPWKEILEAYFPQAMQFFFPQTAELINWERPHEFLDKEFQQIAREAELGRRYVDKLVKVWQIQGQETWLLIHVEIQAKSEDTFAERMFSYNLRIFDRFGKPAMSLAILSDTDPTWRPNQYSYNYPNTRLNFEFGTVKLLDYQNRWTESPVEYKGENYSLRQYEILGMAVITYKLLRRSVWVSTGKNANVRFPIAGVWLLARRSRTFFLKVRVTLNSQRVKTCRRGFETQFFCIKSRLPALSS